MLLDFVFPFVAFATDTHLLIAVFVAWGFGIGMTVCIAINHGQSGIPWAFYAAIFPPMAFIHALLLAPFNYQSANHQRKQTVELLEKIVIVQANILKALEESNHDENAESAA